MAETKKKEEVKDKTAPEVNREKVTTELNDLNNEYKSLVQKRQGLINELKGVEEELCKKIGAFQALRKLLGDGVTVNNGEGK